MRGIDIEKLRLVLLGKDAPDQIDLWDILAHQNYEIELALLYGSAFWPDLIEVDGYVLLAENYDESAFRRLLITVGPQEIEKTINTTYLWQVFGRGEAEDAVWERLGAVLCQSWKCRAESAFPDRRFYTEFAWYSDVGDPGITLYSATREGWTRN